MTSRVGATYTSRRAYDELAGALGPGINGPFTIVVARAPHGAAELGRDHALLDVENAEFAYRGAVLRTGLDVTTPRWVRVEIPVPSRPTWRHRFSSINSSPQASR